MDTTKKECETVVQCETSTEVVGDTQSAVPFSEICNDMSIHSTDLIDQINNIMLSKYESSDRVWRYLWTVYGQVRTIDTDRYFRHIGFLKSENYNYVYEWRSDDGVIYIALCINDLLVTVSKNLVKWFNVNNRHREY